jgi:hypothetical protein
MNEDQNAIVDWIVFSFPSFLSSPTQNESTRLWIILFLLSQSTKINDSEGSNHAQQPQSSQNKHQSDNMTTLDNDLELKQAMGVENNDNDCAEVEKTIPFGVKDGDHVWTSLRRSYRAAFHRDVIEPEVLVNVKQAIKSVYDLLKVGFDPISSSLF